jgi:hypothetical protein
MKPQGLVVILLIAGYLSQAQPTAQAVAGVGFTEHFSLGAGCTFAGKHTVTLLYGSDFFYRRSEFSTYMGQYHFQAHRWKFSNFTPVVGVRGGHTIFTDKYYRWQVMVFIPFAGIQYPLNKNIDLTVQAGGAVSFEQKVERLNYGEIGHYHEFLPELKACVAYKFKNKGK